MAEYKNYITQIQENGNVMISEDVVATISTQAMAEVEGVAGFSAKPGADIPGMKGNNKGLKVQIAEDNTITVHCNVMIRYGHSVVEVAKAIQTSVTNALESMTGVKVGSVNVNVCGIVRQ